MTTTLSPHKIHEEVKERYGRLADEFKVDVLPEQSGGCCGDTVSDGYCGTEFYDVDVSNLPQDVTGMSLGCGDPIAIAELLPGQTVLDLGSGGGIDCFLAAQRVGESGYVIGVDMTESMLAKANRNKEKMGATNVEFRQGQIEALPVDDDIVDVIISNCVINLSPDKTAVFRDAFRVLKPGGKLAVSDMVTQGQFTPEERADMSKWAGCITGAEDVADYVAWMQAAGFSQISIVDKANPQVKLAGLPRGKGQARIFSGRITAVKPTS
ncbi:MAG: arsenite methyltransferase [Chloroflexi bacterium]|nr:arsenite methyltransferase [Chloroflexota bacterium]